MAMREIKNGAKIGKLTIIYFAESQPETICICSCECCRIVKLSEAELKTRKACLNCESKKELKKFKQGDLAIYRNAIGELAFGEQVIIAGINEIENVVEIESRGKLYKCRAGDLENLGVNFYEKRNSRHRGRQRNNKFI